MKRYEFQWGHPVENVDGEWIRYEDHIEAMKRIAYAAPGMGADSAGGAVWTDDMLAKVKDGAQMIDAKMVSRELLPDSAGEAEPVAWHIGNADGSINKIGAVYIRRSLAEKHVESYGGELDARIVPLYAAPAPNKD